MEQDIADIPILATVPPSELTNASRERCLLTADEAGEGGETEKISEEAT